MLKYIVFILINLSFLSSLVAQPRETHPRYFVGVYLGPNLSGFSGNYIANVEGESGKIRLRTQYGFFGKIFITNDISVFTAIQLNLNGALTKNDDAKSATVSISYTAKTNLTTLAIPALITYTPRLDYGIVIGPQFDLILSAKEPWNRTSSYKPEGYNENVIDKYNRMGLSLAIGGYYLLLNGTSLHLRYTHGLTNMTKEEYGDAKPYSIQFFLGINIYKKTK